MGHLESFVAYFRKISKKIGLITNPLYLTRNVKYRITNMELALQHKLKLLESTIDIEQKKEQSLIEGVKSGSRAAQKKLYQKYFGKMSGVALRYTRSKEDAYEVLNDAFMQVFKSLDNYRGEEQLSGWIYRIVQNTAFGYARKNYKIKEVKAELKPTDATVSNDALSNIGLTVIYDNIQKLPDAQRTVLSMYILDGLKHREIAEQLSISVGTSKWYLSTARTQLQELLKQAQ